MAFTLIPKSKAAPSPRATKQRFPKNPYIEPSRHAPPSHLTQPRTPTQPLVQAKLELGEPNDKFEQEADRVADQVMRAREGARVPIGKTMTPLGIRRFTGQPSGLQTAPPSVSEALASPGTSLEPGLRQDMELRFGQDFSRVRVHCGSAAEESAQDINAHAYTMGQHIVFGRGRFAPETYVGQRLIAHELTHVVQQSQGNSGGRVPEGSVQRQGEPTHVVEVGVIFMADERKRTDTRYARSIGRQDAARIRKLGVLPAEDRQELNAKLRFFEGRAWEIYGQEIKPTLLEVTRHERAAKHAASTLASLSERRRRGEQIDDRSQLEAQKEAHAAAENVVIRAKDSSGNEITDVLRSIFDQISRIEAARARGYLQAIGDLSAKGLDKEADYDAFAQSLAGNLLWALSGVLPAAPLTVLLTSGLKAFFHAKWIAPGPRWTAAVGTAGAMIAQFSAGVPSSSSVAHVKIELEKTLTKINASICNGLRRDAYEYLADAVASAPPDPTSDAPLYSADLELGLRYALYGDVYSKHLNDGDQPDASKVQQAARDELLRQYVVGNAALSEGEVVATRAKSDQVNVDDAVDLLGGKAALDLQPYELVINQIRSAADDLGCSVDLDPSTAAQSLREGRVVSVPVTHFDRSRLFSASTPTRWMRMVAQEKILKLNPEFDNEAYMGASGITRITNVIVAPERDLASAEINGKRVYTAKYVHFYAVGSGRREGDFIRVRVPSAIDIRYRIAPITSHEKWWGGEP